MYIREFNLGCGPACQEISALPLSSWLVEVARQLVEKLGWSEPHDVVHFRAGDLTGAASKKTTWTKLMDNTKLHKLSVAANVDKMHKMAQDIPSRPLWVANDWNYGAGASSTVAQSLACYGRQCAFSDLAEAGEFVQAISKDLGVDPSVTTFFVDTAMAKFAKRMHVVDFRDGLAERIRAGIEKFAMTAGIPQAKVDSWGLNKNVKARMGEEDARIVELAKEGKAFLSTFTKMLWKIRENTRGRCP
mmetsp:Transcript_34019/g.108105  ORF Transcript_34019/g.108105 Transcript_34019/m.108105 type:complete len:246 (+) Transcript_34019:179-916(+)